MAKQIELPQGALEMLILKAISLGSLHGYGILLRIQQISGERLEILQGSFYTAIYRLERRGWIEGEWGESENNRRAKYYRLTAAGKRQLKEEAAKWSDMADVIAAHSADKTGGDMSVFATLRCWWRAIAHRSRVHREVEDELRFHIDAYANDLVRQGMSPADAERKARIDLGRADVQGEKYRDAVGLRAWDEIWSDLRYGVRGLLRNPGFAAVTILSLALSIGMATAMFSLVHAVLLDVYPYADSDRTVNPIVFDPAHPNDWDWFVLTRDQFRTYRSSPLFEDVLGQANFPVQLQQDDGESQALMVALTANAAPFLKVKPLIGRGLQPSDGDYGDPAPNIAVLGYKFWIKQFAGDASVLGRKLTYSTGLPGQKAQSVTIVGVMPERFTLGGTPDFYMPMSQVTFPDAAHDSLRQTQARSHRTTGQHRRRRNGARICSAGPSDVSENLSDPPAAAHQRLHRPLEVCPQLADSVPRRRHAAAHRLRELLHPPARAGNGPHPRVRAARSHRCVTIPSRSAASRRVPRHLSSRIVPRRRAFLLPRPGAAAACQQSFPIGKRGPRRRLRPRLLVVSCYGCRYPLRTVACPPLLAPTDRPDSAEEQP